MSAGPAFLHPKARQGASAHTHTPPHPTAAHPSPPVRFDGTKRFDPATGDLVDAEVKAEIAALVAKLAAAAQAHAAAAPAAGTQ